MSTKFLTDIKSKRATIRKLPSKFRLRPVLGASAGIFAFTAKWLSPKAPAWLIRQTDNQSKYLEIYAKIVMDCKISSLMTLP